MNLRWFYCFFWPEILSWLLWQYRWVLINTIMIRPIFIGSIRLNRFHKPRFIDYSNFQNEHLCQFILVCLGLYINSHTHTHTHTHIYIYIYIYIVLLAIHSFFHQSCSFWIPFVKKLSTADMTSRYKLFSLPYKNNTDERKEWIARGTMSKNKPYLIPFCESIDLSNILKGCIWQCWWVTGICPSHTEDGLVWGRYRVEW